MPSSANFIPSLSEYIRILPEIIITIVAIAVMMLEAVRDEARNRGGSLASSVTLLGLVAALAATFVAHSQPGAHFSR